MQVFRNGIVESAAGDVRTSSDGKNFLPARTLENEVSAKVYDYMGALSEAGVLPPLFVMLGGVRMHGTVFADADTAAIPPAIPRSNLYFPSIVAEQYGAREVYRRVLKPIFDAIWNAAGYAERPAS